MASKKEHLPIVSIIIPTYNSSLYVLETLESAKAQTYKNIELIVSDDCSNDATVEICRKWMADNKDRFINTWIITSPVNTGIASNSNRGLQKANGKWIKFIAGDDILLRNCIQTNFEFTLHNNASFIFSRHIWFKVNQNGKKCTPSDTLLLNKYWGELNKNFFMFDAKKQYHKLLFHNYPPASTSFMEKSTLLMLGGYDEDIPLLEDYPLWIRATKQNYKLFFIDSDTVLYRKHEHSASSSANINLRYLKNNYKLYKTYMLNVHTYPHPFFHLSVHVNYLNHLLIAKSGKRNLLNKILQLFDPNYTKNRIFRKNILNDILNGPFSLNETLANK